MAGVTGLEPAASGVTGRRSNRLSYTPLRAGVRPEATKSMYGLGFLKSRQRAAWSPKPRTVIPRRRGGAPRNLTGPRVVGGERLELPTSTV